MTRFILSMILTIALGAHAKAAGPNAARSFAGPPVTWKRLTPMLGRWRYSDGDQELVISRHENALLAEFRFHGRHLKRRVFPVMQNGELYVVARLTDRMITHITGSRFSDIGSRRCYFVRKFTLRDRDLLEIAPLDEALTIEANPGLGLGPNDISSTCPAAFLGTLSVEQHNRLSLVFVDDPNGLSHLHRVGPGHP